MTKWEYLAFTRVGGSWTDDRYDDRSPQDKLSNYGMEGWELVSVVYDSAGYNYYLKRPLAAKKKTAAKKPKSTAKSTKT